MPNHPLNAKLTRLDNDPNVALIYSLMIATAEGFAASLRRDPINGTLHVMIATGTERLTNGRSFEKFAHFDAFNLGERLLALAFKHNINFSTVKKAAQVDSLEFLPAYQGEQHQLHLSTTKDGRQVFCDIHHFIVREIIGKYKQASAQLDAAATAVNAHIDPDDEDNTV
jgi:hypothetical protein